MSKEEIVRALDVIEEYCDSNRSCKTCLFDKARSDMGLTCRVAELFDDKRYREVLK